MWELGSVWDEPGIGRSNKWGRTRLPCERDLGSHGPEFISVLSFPEPRLTMHGSCLVWGGGRLRGDCRIWVTYVVDTVCMILSRRTGFPSENFQASRIINIRTLVCILISSPNESSSCSNSARILGTVSAHCRYRRGSVPVQINNIRPILNQGPLWLASPNARTEYGLKKYHQPRRGLVNKAGLHDPSYINTIHNTIATQIQLLSCARSPATPLSCL